MLTFSAVLRCCEICRSSERDKSSIKPSSTLQNLICQKTHCIQSIKQSELHNGLQRRKSAPVMTNGVESVASNGCSDARPRILPAADGIESMTFTLQQQQPQQRRQTQLDERQTTIHRASSGAIDQRVSIRIYIVKIIYEHKRRHNCIRNARRLPTHNANIHSCGLGVEM